VKAGSGTFELTGNNGFAGGVDVNAGTLLVNNASGLGTGTGAVTVAANATLGGKGTIVPNVGNLVTINGTLAPGGELDPGGTLVNPINTLSIGAPANPAVVTFQNGGVLAVEIAGNGDAAADRDQLAVTGVLNFLTVGGSPRVRVLRSGGSFDPNQVHTYTIATAGAPIQLDGSPTANLNGLLDTSGFASPGSFSLARNGNQLVLTFQPVPEPAAVALLFTAVVGAAEYLRRRRPGAARE
jgi:autotransporter-associated beta strand protein